MIQAQATVARWAWNWCPRRARRWGVVLLASLAAVLAASWTTTATRPAAPKSASTTPKSANTTPKSVPGLGQGTVSLAGGGVAALFGPRGVTVNAGGERLSLQVVAVGRGSRMRALAAVSPRLRAGRAVYARAGGVLEWYVRKRSGVEQGFTLARRPPGRSGELTAELRFGGLRARLDGSNVEFFAR
ncbi:MAG: hypothetical protein JOY58_08180, partial [Solirubrobacterales bacterium]|nr:hypothetical protein [Solirubrobacterales bacterium]